MYQEKKPTILDSKKYKLEGKRTEKGAPSMQFGVYNGNPSITVFTNDPNDPEKKPIRGPMDGIIWSALVTMVEQIIDDPSLAPRQLELRTGHPARTIPEAYFIVGRDPETNAVFFALKKNGRPTKKFELLPTVYSNLMDKDGNVLPVGDQSTIMAKGFIRAIDTQVQALMRETFVPPQPKQGGGGGGQRQQNYGNQNQQSGGGYQQQSQQPQQTSAGSYGDDDIPM